MSEEPELLPCPFCGSEGQLNDHILKTLSGHYTANAQCASCKDVVIDQVYASSRQEAVRGAALVWNTRTPVPLVWSNEKPTAPGRYLVRHRKAGDFGWEAKLLTKADLESKFATTDQWFREHQFAGPLVVSEG